MPFAVADAKSNIRPGGGRVSDRARRTVTAHAHGDHALAAELSASPRVRRLSALGRAINGGGAPVQRIVKKARGSSGQWYTTLDSGTLFDSKGEADEHERSLLEARKAPGTAAA